MLRTVVQLLVLAVPWRARRHVLRLLGFDLAPTARIGLSVVLSDTVVMGEGACIGNFNVVRNIEELVLEAGAAIGNWNHVSGIPRCLPQLAATERRIALVMGRGALMTNRHQVDCSSLVTLEENSLVAGAGSTIASHWIDLQTWTMRSSAIVVGAHSMVGTRCILLGGARLPARSALGAGSVLRTAEIVTERIYAGVPAVEVAPIDATAKFFVRGATLGTTVMA